MEFQFDINLRRMAMFAYGLSFWKTKEMEYKLKQFVYPYGRFGKMKFLDQLVEEVVQKIDPASFPVALYSELMEIFKKIPYQMYDWFNYIRRRKIFRDQSRRQIYDKFCKDIYCTHYGTIDEAKILKYSWINIENVDLIKVYVMACCFCVEDLITKLWDEIIEKNIQFIPYEKLYNRSGFHLVAYWNKLRENKLDQDFINSCIVPYSGPDLVYDTEKSIEVNMLSLSVCKGYAAAAKYFWNKITEQEKTENIAWFMTNALDHFGQISQVEAYKRDQSVMMVFFFMNYMNEDIKKEVFLKKKITILRRDEYKYIAAILEWCIEIWPWQDFFKLLFKKLNHFFNDFAYQLIFSTIVYHSSRQKNPLFNNLLPQVWNCIPSEFKSYVALHRHIIPTLLEMGNISCIKLIFFDENLISEQSVIIKSLHRELRSMMRKNEVEKLREFFHKILVPQNLAEKHQNILKFVYDVLMHGNMNLISKSLNRLSRESEEVLKSIVDPEIFSYYFIIKNQFDIADQFLYWEFDDEEKVKKFKKDFRKNEFVMNHISNLWKIEKENVETAKQNSDKFLLWLLGKEEKVVIFKAQKIFVKVFSSLIPWSGYRGTMDHQVYDFYAWEDFINQYHLNILEDFLQWIYLNEEGVQKFKNTIFKKDLPYIIQHFIKIGDCEIIFKLCKWAFDSNEEIFNLLKDTLLSKGGIISCKYYISKYSNPDMFNRKPKDEMTSDFINFINFWVKPSKNFDDLKERLKSWPRASIETFEEIGSDDGSTAEIYSDCTDDEDDDNDIWIYCDFGNYELFLKSLDEVKNKEDGS